MNKGIDFDVIVWKKLAGKCQETWLIMLCDGCFFSR